MIKIALLCGSFAFFSCLPSWLHAKSERVSHLTFAVPSVEHFLSGIVIHHGVVTVLVCELYIGVPGPSRLCVICKVDSCLNRVVLVNCINDSTSYERISHCTHGLWNEKERKPLILFHAVYATLKVDSWLKKIESYFLIDIASKHIISRQQVRNVL